MGQEEPWPGRNPPCADQPAGSFLAVGDSALTTSA